MGTFGRLESVYGLRGTFPHLRRKHAVGGLLGVSRRCQRAISLGPRPRGRAQVIAASLARERLTMSETRSP